MDLQKNWELSWCPLILIYHGVLRFWFRISFYPHKTQGRGLLLAVLRKSVPSLPVHFKSGKFSLKHIKSPEAINSWLQNPESFDFYMREEKIVAIQSCHGPLLEWLQQNVKGCAVWGRCMLGQRERFIAFSALALSISLNKKDFLSWMLIGALLCLFEERNI